MSTAPYSRILRLEQIASTNTFLWKAAADADHWPHLSTVIAEHQTDGHGRTGREWLTPAGTSLTASILLRPLVAPERLSWVTLLAGLATVRSLRGLAPQQAERIALKWPNDVVVLDADECDVEGWDRHRKIAGILAEVASASTTTQHEDAPTTDQRASRTAVVVGVGVNLRQGTEDLPVPWASSLALVGLPATSAEELHLRLGTELAQILHAWEAADGDVAASGLADEVRDCCTTLGREISAQRPGGATLTGTATKIDDEGRLVVRRSDGTTTAVLAGDISLVRNP